jgi:hypothetical protein
MLFWRCWHLRNNVVHDNGKATIADSVNFLANYAGSINPVYVSANEKGKGPMLGGTVPDCQWKGRVGDVWKAPPEYWAKINVDAAFDPTSGRASIGVIVRDCRGLTLYATSSHIAKCTFAIGAEAMACLHGARVAADQSSNSHNS